MTFIEATSVIQSIVTTAAIIVGGLWAYFHFIRRREYSPRIKALMTAQLVRVDGIDYALLHCNITNLGESRVAADRRNTGVRIHYCASEQPDCDPSDYPVHKVHWIHSGTYPVFAHHEWLEGHELVEEERMIAVRNTDYCALKVELWFCSGEKYWSSACILPRLISDSSD